MFRILIQSTAFILFLFTPVLAQTQPEGFEQILPRGRIAAITQPMFVSAEEADIAQNSWVLGVYTDGVARAYSLNLLNAHEVVNDQVGDLNFAAVW